MDLASSADHRSDQNESELGAFLAPTTLAGAAVGDGGLRLDHLPMSYVGPSRLMWREKSLLEGYAVGLWRLAKRSEVAVVRSVSTRKPDLGKVGVNEVLHAHSDSPSLFLALCSPPEEVDDNGRAVKCLDLEVLKVHFPPSCVASHRLYNCMWAPLQKPSEGEDMQQWERQVLNGGPMLHYWEALEWWLEPVSFGRKAALPEPETLGETFSLGDQVVEGAGASPKCRSDGVHNVESWSHVSLKMISKAGKVLLAGGNCPGGGSMSPMEVFHQQARNRLEMISRLET